MSVSFSPASVASRVRVPLSAMLVATAVLSVAPTVLAQDGSDGGSGASASQKDLSGVTKGIGDFVHYVLIGKADLAQASAEAVLGMSMSDADLAEAIDGADMGERLAKALSRSRSMEGVSDLATRIEDRVEKGRKSLARDPKRIAESISMLGKSLRQQRLGEERLLASGEYAVPQLLKVLVDAKDPSSELAATKNLIALRRHAVTPLGLALNSLDPVSQRKVVGVLAEIAWPTALPYVVDLASRPSTKPEVKAACEAAFAQLGGTSRDVSAQYTQLARNYFDRESSLVPYANDPVNNIWSHDDASGFGMLTSNEVATGVYCDEMAKLLARRALAVDAGNTAALAIYIASDLRQENTLGSDAKAGRYSPQFFATASGASVCSEVLALAIDSKDVSLVRDAIGVLAQTASGNALVSTGGRVPMIDALRYGERRVRLDAALALAYSNPTQSFAADFRVVPILAAAVSDEGKARAAVIGGSATERQGIANELAAAGIASLALGANYGEIETDVVKSQGIDMVVLCGSVEEMSASLGRVRSSGVTAASPVLAVVAAAEESMLRKAFDGDTGFAVWTAGSSADSLRSAANSAMASMSGTAMDAEEMNGYAMEAAAALRHIALRGSKIFSIADAEPALLNALSTKTGALRLEVADVLAHSNSAQAQRALVDAALSSTGEEQIALLDAAAMAARATGSKADQRQLAALRELIASSEGATADAAGRLHGSLDAGSAEAVKLITGN
jgi:hypothetical protein